MPKKIDFTDEQKREIERMYLEGNNLISLSRIFKEDKRLIRNFLKSIGQMMSRHERKVFLISKRNISVACLCGCGLLRPKFDINGKERKYFVGHHGRGKFKNDKNAKIFCACGCQKTLLKYDKWGGERKYILGHFRKRKGETAYNPIEKIFCGCGCRKEIFRFDKWHRERYFVHGHAGVLNKGKKNPSLTERNLRDNPSKRPEVREKMRIISSHSFIERFGEEKARDAKIKISNHIKGKPSHLKNRTYEEIHGEEKAKKLKEIRSIDGTGRVMPEWTDKQRQDASDRYLKLWQDQEYRDKTLKNMLQNRYAKPNNYERKISDVCFKYNLPFVYCGDGTFLIGLKSPDFINKEQRIAIEVYNNYHKNIKFGSVEKYKTDRIKYFAEYGYKIIFIGEEIMEERNWEQLCVNKIKEGMKNE